MMMEDAVLALTFSRDSEMLASGSESGQVRQTSDSVPMLASTS